MNGKCKSNMYLLILADQCNGIPAYDEIRKFSYCHVIYSNANKRWFKRQCVVSRESEASRSGIHDPRNLHHTNKYSSQNLNISQSASVSIQG